MKYLFLCILMIIVKYHSFSQYKIGVVNQKDLNQTHPLNYYYDSIYKFTEQKFEDSITILVKKFDNKIKSFLHCRPLPDSIANNKTSRERYYRMEEDSLYNMQVDIETLSESKWQILADIENDKKETIKKDIEVTITNFNQSWNYDYIIDNQGIIYCNPELDITDKIKEQIRRRY